MFIIISDDHHQKSGMIYHLIYYKLSPKKAKKMKQQKDTQDLDFHSFLLDK